MEQKLELPHHYVIPGILRSSINDPEGIVNVVCMVCGTEPESIKRKTRKREIVWTRQLSMWWIQNKNPKMSLNQVGKPFGKHHATVIHAIKTVNNLIATDKKCKEDWDSIEKYLKFGILPGNNPTVRTQYTIQKVHRK